VPVLGRPSRAGAARARDKRARLDALLRLERSLWATGLTEVAGVDEAGMGPLAGPVVAAAVVFAPGTEIVGIDDSKRLGEKRREALAQQIRARAAGVGIGIAQVDEIDRINIYQAGLVAMLRAVSALARPPQQLLVDARTIPDVAIPQTPYVKGDTLSYSIAAASIVAKTQRDALMRELDDRHPGYGFAAHKGYDTRVHREALARLGPCAAHRMSYAAIGEICGGYSDAFYALRRALDAARDATSLAAFERDLLAGRETLGDVEARKLRLLATRRRKALGV
jgi:ribonuclease HII